MKELSFKAALLSDGWASNVLIKVDAQGDIASIQSGVPGIAGDACALPGMANLHSHAHQRAMAGLAEQAGASEDSFWTWRQTMYQFLEAIQPQHLNAIAAQLYMEMLKAGYTRVAEFQYLHHQKDGAHYEQIAEMSLQTMQAARATGLGITNLPVLYSHGGFGGQPVSDQQARFTNAPDALLEIINSLQGASAGDKNVVNGIAAHSLRAVTKEALGQLIAAVQDPVPTHIHIAEQPKEIEDCLAWSGYRPVDYLMDNFDVDRHWCLVHATHMTNEETKKLALSGAVAGLCPTTEANLGDGLFNASRYLDNGGHFGIGSDSHISVSPVEELRWLEYGQRLKHGSRNQLASETACSTGRRLFEGAATGGAQACGHNSGAIAVGKRADIVVLDLDHPLLCGRDGDQVLDSWIFSGNSNPVSDVYVGGEHIISEGQHIMQEQIEQRFKATIKELRS